MPTPRPTRPKYASLDEAMERLFGGGSRGGSTEDLTPDEAAALAEQCITEITARLAT